MNVHVVKPIPIDFKEVVDAYGKIKRGGKATGIDKEGWSDFEKKLQDNFYSPKKPKQGKASYMAFTAEISKAIQKKIAEE